MIIVKIFIFYSVFKVLFSESVFEETIVEGLKTYEIQRSTIYSFIFKAVDNGTYVIIFPEFAKIIEATGRINPEMIIDGSGYLSAIYAQNFQEGNHVKILFPRYKESSSSNITVSIQKLDSNFIMFPYLYSNLYTLEYNDLTKPVYIFISNLPDQEYFRQQLKFYVQVHSGQFTGSYRKSVFKETNSIYEGFENFTLNKEVDLPINSINIVKLQCLKPGIITLYYSRDSIVSFYKGTNVSYYNTRMIYTYHYYKQAPTYIYFQVFSLNGDCSEVDFTKINGGIYRNSFYTKIYYPYTGYYNVYVQGFNCLMLSHVNVGETNKTIEKKKKIY